MLPFVIAVGLALLGLAVLGFVLWARRGARSGAAIPAAVPVAAAAPVALPGPASRLKAAAIPAELHDLIPLAERWGLSDDDLRRELQQRSSACERAEFQAALRGRTAQVDAWLSSLPLGDETAEPCAFMYMLHALDEMDLWPDPRPGF